MKLRRIRRPARVPSDVDLAQEAAFVIGVSVLFACIAMTIREFL